MTENELEWNPGFVPGNPLFDHLRALFPDLPTHWPDLGDLNRLLPAGLRSAGAAPLGFVRQTEPLSALAYERRIHSKGRIPTRECSWHDLFNALMWATFPAAKCRLNAIQAGEGMAATGNARSRRRDWCTLVDECGVLVASVDPMFRALHREHRWEHLFCDLRGSWDREIGAFIIGHGLYQQSLAPYLGLTGKAVYLAVETGFFELDLRRRYAHLDQILARRLAGAPGPESPRELLPLPVLGVPGWHRGEQDRRFYRIASYFRPRS